MVFRGHFKDRLHACDAFYKQLWNINERHPFDFINWGRDSSRLISRSIGAGSFSLYKMGSVSAWRRERRRGAARSTAGEAATGGSGETYTNN